MRVIIVGSDKIYAIENFYKKYLEELGATVSIFTAQNYFYDYYQRSVFNKLLYKTALSGIIPKINRLFKKNVSLFQPDVIWVFKGMEIAPASLVWAKKRGIKLVNYNPDNPFIFSGSGSGNRNVTDSISLYDLHFTYNLEVKERLEKEYQALTAFLPFGFDLRDDLFRDCADQKEILKICFAGNPDASRAAFIEGLAEAGLQIDLYGNNWSRFVRHPSVAVFSAVYGDEFWKVLRRYRVQLNLMRLHNEDSHNMRSFEIPGVGGIMLAPNTIEHRMFFNDGLNVFLFNDLNDCIRLARCILEMPAADAESVRQKAREHSVETRFTYRERTIDALQRLQMLRS